MSKEIIFPDSEYIVTENYTKQLSAEDWWYRVCDLYDMLLTWPNHPNYEFGFTGFQPVEGSKTLVKGGIYVKPKKLL